MGRKLNNLTEEENPFTLSIGDLMAALLLIFILLLSITVLNLKEKIIEKQNKFESVKEELYKELDQEFKDKKELWNMEIDSTKLLIRFNSVNADSNIALFSWEKAGDYEVTSSQKRILDEFFPRYSRIIYRENYNDTSLYRNYIQEVRIEGHTDESWGLDNENSYFKNMELSQNRTRSILEYSFKTVEQDTSLQQWLIEKITANGLSYSRPRPGFISQPTAAAHRRVEFRIVLDAEAMLTNIERKDGSNKPKEDE